MNLASRLIAAFAVLTLAGFSPAFAQGKTTPINCSGTITTGGTAQLAFSGSSALTGFVITNLDTAEPLWISLTGTAAVATSGSFPLAAGATTTFAGAGTFATPDTFRPDTGLSVVAATTGHKWSCMRW